MKTPHNHDEMTAAVLDCDRCPRLREHCRDIARKKRASYRSQKYHGLPVPNFGDPAAQLLIAGLAPAAHGANRTGRMFTGDRSGDWLYRAMHRAGFANQPTATSRDDGLQLHNAMITAAVHCAPPANKPTTQEIANCAPWLDHTVDLLPNLRVVICLGRLGFDAIMRLYKTRGWFHGPRSAYPFAHGAEHPIANAPTVICSYHPSQQNTFTGRLTEPMLDSVFQRAQQIIESH